MVTTAEERLKYSKELWLPSLRKDMETDILKEIILCVYRWKTEEWQFTRKEHEKEG